MAQILQPTDENLRRMRKFLRLQGLVAIPTETVYGLAANALDARACAKIFAAKGRPSNDPLICHVGSYSAIDSICHRNPLAAQLAARFWPGPLSLVLPKKAAVPDLVTAGLPSVAVRCPSHPVFRQLIEDCDFPLAAPSANPFAYISPTTAAHVEAGLGDKIDYILDGGPSSHGVESTILDLRHPEKPRILRYGALAAEAIETEIDQPVAKPAKDLKPNQAALAPGALPKHYSPRTRLDLRATPISTAELEAAASDTAFLLLTRPQGVFGPHIHWLSEHGELSQIAASLYGQLRALDQGSFTQIIAEEAPELGLGLAINDRLRRAASK